MLLLSSFFIQINQAQVFVTNHGRIVGCTLLDIRLNRGFFLERVKQKYFDVGCNSSGFNWSFQ